MGKSKSSKWFDEDEYVEEHDKFSRERARRDDRRGKNQDREKQLRYDEREGND
jgi:hypothetical protein